MKKTFTLLAMAVFAANVSAQVITQNTDAVTVTALNSVACGAGGLTADNFYSRAFTLADYAITYDYKITNIQFGVETASEPLNATVNLYSLVGTYPGGTKTLLKSVDVPVTPADALKLVSTGTNLTQVVPAGSKIVLEVAHDGGSVVGFYLGTNASAETKPSYVKSVTCSIPNPVTTTSIGFPNAHWVMTITGVNNLGVTEIINSKNLQVYPNPVKDVLNFKLANNLKVESIELFDMTGKKVITVNSKATQGVNVAGFAKGTYILKVKGSDGNVYIQKVLKN
ncbi:T9SS type A sorting domain-containing protein [Kaistella jeonii]|uniref:Secretion system C-terminal sorting domain-containing protein n=1 Tax=Kaistella jeonii TaxID=266749 RepID=A0A0C1D1F7_9FLAO|nr:T9SS type A sorting domain-containing protein [Kaistella jeonii]KIA90616.1 hypothetical protein OA86_01670 [Kaistella jeonii]SFB70059.1 Por secretion system C-terminal sorting domain-containing protein [Kaistella jeonii]VEI94788.1 Por secretion system C-terminal sorting domain [Kaistella jeonii]